MRNEIKKSKPNHIKPALVRVKILEGPKCNTIEEAIYASLAKGRDNYKAILFAVSAYPVNVALFSIGKEKFIYKVQPVSFGKEVECADNTSVSDRIIRTMNLKSVEDFSREILFSLDVIVDSQTIAEIGEFFN